MPVRLDVWLDVACLFRTRSEAQQACKGGKVDVNGQSAKPHREVKPGDIIEITRPLGRRQRVVVRAVADQHIPKAQARAALRGHHAAALARGTGPAGPATVARPADRRDPARRTGGNGAGCGRKRRGRQLRQASDVLYSSVRGPTHGPLLAGSARR